MESSPKKTVSNSFKKLKSNISLVQYNSSSGEEVDDQPSKKGILATKNGGTSTTAVPSGDKSLTKSFLMWENSANVCWLDASMALLVHNRTLTESLDEGSSTQIEKIIRFYYEAVSILNDYSDKRHIDLRVQAAKDLLKTVQESTLKYLQPILKYKEGEPDSAFCSLFNLITEDKSVKDFFDLEFTWVQVCKKCDTHRVKRHRKPIVTLPRVAIFSASFPIAIYQCPVCKEPDQNMMFNFKTLPQCLLFHFESGAGKGELQCKDFEIDGRTYRMTGVMTLEKGKESLINHFITFIRDPSADTWLECNDLNDEILCFDMIPPFIELDDVYIIMYEAADKLGTVLNSSLALDKCGLGEESVSDSADIPLIDLADDTEKDLPNEKGNGGCNESKVGSKRSKNVGLFETCEDDTSQDSPLNVDPETKTINCAKNVIREGKTLLGSQDVTVTQTLKEISSMNRPSPFDTNEIGVASEKDRSQKLVPLNIITKDVVSYEKIKHSTEGSQAIVQNESILDIEASKKDTNVSCHTSITTKKRVSRMKNLTDTVNKISTNSTFDRHINKTNKNLPNTAQSLISKSEIFLKNYNLNDQSPEKDSKVIHEREIFMLNLDLCQKTKIEKSLQNKHIFPLDQIKNSVSKNNNLEIYNQPQINISPTIIEASNILNDISNKTTPESPKSDGQMVAKTYKKLMHTLETVVLKQEIPLAICTESDKSKVPNTELSNKLASKDLNSEINKTKPLLVHVREDFNYQVLNTDSDLKTQKVLKAIKTAHSDPIAVITAKYPRHNARKTQSKQGKQEHKVSNSQIADTAFDKESKRSLVNILEKNSTILTILSKNFQSSKQRRFLPHGDSKPSAEVAVKGLMCKMNKIQNKLEPNKSNSKVVHKSSKKESDKVKVDTKELTTLPGSNAKRQLGKNGTISPFEKEDKSKSEKAVPSKRKCRRPSVSVPDTFTLPGSNAKRQLGKNGTISPFEKEDKSKSEKAVPSKRKCRRPSVCVPDTFVADVACSIETEKFFSIDTEKRDLVIRGKCNSNLPEMFGNVMEQITDANTPKKADCKQILEAAIPKSPFQRENEINLVIMTDQKTECSQDDQNRHKHSSNDCKQSNMFEWKPSDINETSPIDSEMMECREGCDCDTLGVDETVDIVVDSVLHSIFGFFDIRKH